MRKSYSWTYHTLVSLASEKDGGGDGVKAKYRVHRFDVLMRRDQARFEQFLNSLEEEVVSVIPVSLQAGPLEEWELEPSTSG